jgi:hypothetical protein
VSEFRPGEIVDITIKGARVQRCEDDSLEYEYRTELGSFEAVVAVDSPGVTVERVAPAEWPPQPGDLWRDKIGETWFAFRDKGVSLMVPSYPVNASRGGRNPDTVLEKLCPLTLVYREGGEAS